MTWEFLQHSCQFKLIYVPPDIFVCIPHVYESHKRRHGVRAVEVHCMKSTACCQVIRTKLERVSSFFVVLSTCRFAWTHRYIYCRLKKSCVTWNMEAWIFWLLFVWNFRVLFTICFVFRLCVSCVSHHYIWMCDISIFHMNLLISVLWETQYESDDSCDNYSNFIAQ